MSPQRRKTLIGVNAGIALAHVGNFIWFPILIATLGSTNSGFWAGFVMFMTYVGRLLATFFYEGFCSRMSTRSVVFFGAGMEAIALGLMGFSGGIFMYSTLAFFIGFGSGTVFPGLKNVLISYPEEERPKAFSTFQMSTQVGLFGGALAGGYFVGVDLRILFTVVFAIFVGFCLSATMFIPKHGFEAGTGEVAKAPRSTTKIPLFNLAVLKGIEVRGATRYFMLSSVFWFLSMSFVVGIPLHMQEYVPQLAPSAPFWITGLTLLILQYPLFNFLIKRFDPGTVMAIGLVGMTLAFLSFGGGQTLVWVALGCFVVIFGEILFAPSFDMWVSRKVSEDRLAKAMGAMHFFRSVGNMTGAISAGLFFDLAFNTGVSGLNWYIVAVVAAGCAIICLISRERSPDVAAFEAHMDKEDAMPKKSVPAR
ncbi:MFS transporter [Natronoglycomyces albus]|uniref:MFS transporter n=1 Tax=Natronoglycomyces albus TaxID=2811108 RepID=A0A895XMD1_9ACTN|nr:MFS transporter [Natronoglycomyces albus]QSB04155.1 MFS transporter [Natronoglycomyces albus]